MGGNMANNKLIPCRVCRKLFKPCSYCQSHSDTFRWRNFACSKECASKYISDTIAYRENLHKKDTLVSEVQPQSYDDSQQKLEDIKKDTAKKNYKKKSYETTDKNTASIDDNLADNIKETD